jgi:hypothetical protein
MRRTLATLIVALLAIVPAAQAKGPTSVSITGPGLAKPLEFSARGQPQQLSNYWRLTQELGFFPAAFGQIPSPLLSGRPTGDLGPQYTIRYGVPTRNDKRVVIRQELYPYAKGGPVTHMAPGQKIFGREATGGWYRTIGWIKATLLAQGLPALPPSSDSGSGGRNAAAAVGVALLAGLLGVVGVAAIRRRPRPSPA